ncbi:MAG: hypothetical protein HOP02_15920 [Methylococcaceae bacterium]|nr:hypothetical protein [Methylococcaceae bacterium]
MKASINPAVYRQLPNATASPLKQKILFALFAFLAGVSVCMSIMGGVLYFTPVPIMDMWESISFYQRISLGDWNAWWKLHNEHRIVLSRLLFWVDITWFKGRGIFLIIVNYLLLLLSYLILYACLYERLNNAREQFNRKLLALVLLTIMFSWLQHENMVWTFQSQFLLAYLLPLAAFYYLHKASGQSNHSKRFFVCACVFGVGALGSMANGMLALPLLVVMALLLRMSWRRINCLVLLALLGVTLYRYNYYAPLQHGSLKLALLQQPLAFIHYLLLYLGAPFYFLLGSGDYLIAQLTGVFLIASALLFTWQSLRSSKIDSLQLALLMFVLYIGASAFGTAGGRLIFGLSQALSGRYMTPALQVWSVILILYAPLISRGLSAKKTYYGLLLGLQVLLMSKQSPALQTQEQALYDYQVAALAIELGIQDDQKINLVFPSAALVIEQSKAAIKNDWSIFNHALIKDAAQTIGQNDVQRYPAECMGKLDSHIDLPGDARYVRVKGWLTDLNRQTGEQRIHILNEKRQVIGYAFSGEPTGDIYKSSAVQTKEAGFEGYVLAEYMGQAITLKGLTSHCELHSTLTYSDHDRFRLQLAALALLMGVRDSDQAVLLKNTAIIPITQELEQLISEKATPLPVAHCLGHVRQTYILDDRRYLRVAGELQHIDQQHSPKAARFLDANQHNLGYVLTEKVDHSNLWHFEGYLQAEQLGKSLILQGIQSDCALSVSIAYSPYTVVTNLLDPQPSLITVKAIDGKNTWLGGDEQKSQFNVYQVIGSFNHSDADTGSITLAIKRGDAVYYRSGATVGKQYLWINGESSKQYPLPLSLGWSILKFNMPTLPDTFTVTLVDDGDQVGEWSAIGLRK